MPNPRDDGHGFGVVTADVNDDGLIDLYVANDMNPNFLFLNRGDGTFDDVSDLSGAAYDINGQAQSGMGVDAEDVDGDGLPELFVTNFANEYNTLYQNFGKGIFFDNTAFFGLASDTMPWVGWGCALADFDNDGWPDCFMANGHVDNNRQLLDQPVDYEEIPLLFRNDKGKRFRLATRDAGPYFDTKHVGRGAAFGDIDNDGDIDIVVNHKDGPAALLRNDTKSKNHWVRFVLQGTRSNRDAIGAQLEITIEDRLANPPVERTIYRQRKGGYSLQAHERPAGAGGRRAREPGQEGRDPVAVGDRQHAGEPRGRPRVQGRRAQGRQARAAPGEAREEGRSGEVRPRADGLQGDTVTRPTGRDRRSRRRSGRRRRPSRPIAAGGTAASWDTRGCRRGPTSIASRPRSAAPPRPARRARRPGAPATCRPTITRSRFDHRRRGVHQVAQPAAQVGDREPARRARRSARSHGPSAGCRAARRAGARPARTARGGTSARGPGRTRDSPARRCRCGGSSAAGQVLGPGVDEFRVGRQVGDVRRDARRIACRRSPAGSSAGRARRNPGIGSPSTTTRSTPAQVARSRASGARQTTTTRPPRSRTIGA